MSSKLIQYTYISDFCFVRSLSTYDRCVNRFSAYLRSSGTSNQRSIRFSQCALAPGYEYWVYRQVPITFTVAYCSQFEVLYVYKDCHPHFLVLVYATCPSITVPVVPERVVLASRGGGIKKGALTDQGCKKMIRNSWFGCAPPLCQILGRTDVYNKSYDIYGEIRE